MCRPTIVISSSPMQISGYDSESGFRFVKSLVIHLTFGSNEQSKAGDGQGFTTFLCKRSVNTRER